MYVRTPLSWDYASCRLAVAYRRFGTIGLKFQEVQRMPPNIPEERKPKAAAATTIKIIIIIIIHSR